MLLSILEIISGFGAAFLCTISFVPQAVKIIRSRDTSAISREMYLLFTTGATLWFIYGIVKVDWPIIIANLITTLLAFTILYYKLTEKPNL